MPKGSKNGRFLRWPTWVSYGKYHIELNVDTFQKKSSLRLPLAPSWLHFGLHFSVILETFGHHLGDFSGIIYEVNFLEGSMEATDLNSGGFRAPRGGIKGGVNPSL